MKITIGELAKCTECTAETIRYYEKEGLLPKPMRSGGNYRLYGKEHVARLQFIRQCRSLDMTLNEVRDLLKYRDTPDQNCGEVKTLVDEHVHQIEARIEELLQLKGYLTALSRKCCGTTTSDSCGILQTLSA
jgi:Cd(II)/Pb(II)-responsive transcriptional regulator